MHARRIRTNADVERQNKLFDFCYVGRHICIKKTATKVCLKLVVFYTPKPPSSAAEKKICAGYLTNPLLTT